MCRLPTVASRWSSPLLACLWLAPAVAVADAPEPEVRPATWDMTPQQLAAVGLGQTRANPVPVPAEYPRRNEGAAVDPKRAGGAPAGTIFVNFDGETLVEGADDAHTNTTQLGVFVGEFAPYGEDPMKRAAVMEAVRKDWGEYNILVTDTRPTSGEYTMNMTGPTNPIGPGVLGIAPLDCNDQQTHSNITYAFHSADDAFSPSDTATTIAQEVAHSYGLEHVDEPADIMNPSNAGGDPSFRDECIAIVGGGVVCPDQHMASCDDPMMQNSHQELLNLFGPAIPDAAPPTVTITFPGEGDVFPAGADFEVMVDADDDVGIDTVQLFSNGGVLQNDSTLPYGWGVTNILEGEYVLTVLATDYAGNETMSNVVTIYVGVDPSAGADGTAGDDDAGGGDATDGDTDPGADGEGDGGGCGCTTDPAPAPWAAFGLLALLGLRRRGD
jgi:MYXO-CTERM domain-containing protein